MSRLSARARAHTHTPIPRSPPILVPTHVTIHPLTLLTETVLSKQRYALYQFPLSAAPLARTHTHTHTHRLSKPWMTPADRGHYSQTRYSVHDHIRFSVLMTQFPNSATTMLTVPTACMVCDYSSVNYKHSHRPVWYVITHLQITSTHTGLYGTWLHIYRLQALTPACMVHDYTSTDYRHSHRPVWYVIAELQITNVIYALHLVHEQRKSAGGMCCDG